MGFRINIRPSVDDIAELADLASGTPFAKRIDQLRQYGFPIAIAEDRGRNAFMLETNAISRDTASQAHYLLFCMNNWFDIRSIHFWSPEVSFYDFPASLERERYWVQECFRLAAKMYGWPRWGSEEFGVFDPVFLPDDWRPPSG